MSDSPQVQCIQSYSSQEPDELSVEMADVLHILECTDDGKRSQTQRHTPGVLQSLSYIKDLQ